MTAKLHTAATAFYKLLVSEIIHILCFSPGRQRSSCWFCCVWLKMLPSWISWNPHRDEMIFSVSWPSHFLLLSPFLWRRSEPASQLSRAYELWVHITQVDIEVTCISMWELRKVCHFLCYHLLIFIGAWVTRGFSLTISVGRASLHQRTEDSSLLAWHNHWLYDLVWFRSDLY